MGPPGAGKGSQAEKIVKEYQLTNISTGEMFRESYNNQEPIGIEAMKFIEKGNLVSDEITNEVVRQRLLKKDATRCFLLDGYPRTVTQAVALDIMLNEMSSKLSAVINIVVDHEIILERMVGRRVCRSCGATYHVEFKPTQVEGVCDACGGTLYQRNDDKPESVKNRLNIYQNKTMPIIEYYRGRGILHEVNGMQTFNEVYKDIQNILGEPV